MIRPVPRRPKKWVVTQVPAVSIVIANVQDGLSRRGHTDKEAAGHLGLDDSGFSRRMSGEYAFGAHELVQLARWLRAPSGWPLRAGEEWEWSQGDGTGRGQKMSH